MQKMWLLAILLGFVATPASTQTTRELVNDGKGTRSEERRVGKECRL